MEPQLQSGSGDLKFFCELCRAGIFAGQDLARQLNQRRLEVLGYVRVSEQSAEEFQQSFAECGECLSAAAELLEEFIKSDRLLGGTQSPDCEPANLFGNLSFKNGPDQSHEHAMPLWQIGATVDQAGEQAVQDVFGQIFRGSWGRIQLVAIFLKPGTMKLPEPINEMSSGICIRGSRNPQDSRERS